MLLVGIILLGFGYQLYMDIKGFKIESKIERSVYDRGKSKLFLFIGDIGMKIVEKFNAFENYFVTDNMP